MKIFPHFFLLITVVLLSVTAVIGQSNLPEIVIDDLYNHIKPTGVTTTTNYKIPSSKGIVVDATQYDYSAIKQLNGGNNPDLLYIICESGTFAVTLDFNNKTLIDKTTTQNIGGNGKFKGIEKGDTPILGLGTLKMEGTTASLVTFWVSMIEVD